METAAPGHRLRPAPEGDPKIIDETRGLLRAYLGRVLD
ncbi:hypothetical protein SFUMM280S_07625 [Streptomyces fumanus]